MERMEFVIMLKDSKSGYLDKELTSCQLPEHGEYIYNVYAEEEEGALQVHLSFSTERDVADWEFEAIYDCYDFGMFEKEQVQVYEKEGLYNPVWEIVFPLDTDTIEARIKELTLIHYREIQSVYEMLSGFKEEYMND